MRDYTNKTVFLGIDVHKKTYAVTAICDGQVIKRDTLKASPLALITYCKKYYPGAELRSVYESGFCGFHLHRNLIAAGINNIVVDAAGIETASSNRVKTDKRDSLKLASHLANNRLTGIRVPSVENEEKRALTRLRETFVRQRSRLANQIKAQLHLQGLIPADCKKKIGATRIKQLRSLALLPGFKYVLEQFLDCWIEMDLKIKEIDKEVAKQAQIDTPKEKIFRSVPGIGPTSSRILANELEDLSQFKNERQLFSFIGLTPSEHSSGEHVRQGNITRHGRPLLRKILVQASWKAIKQDLGLADMYDRLAARVGGRKAIVAIARRLIGRIRACFRTGELYQIGRGASELLEAGTRC